MKEKSKDICGVCGAVKGSFTKGIRTTSGEKICLCASCRGLADEAIEKAIKESGCHGPWFITVIGTNLSVNIKEEIKDGAKNKN